MILFLLMIFTRINMKTQAVFEIDDYPIDYKNTINYLDILKEINKDLKITLFAIPTMLNEKSIELVEKREWIRMGVHGYNHDRGESACFKKESQAIKVLHKTLAVYPNFRKIYKARSYSYCPAMVKALKNMGFIISLQDVRDIFNMSRHFHKWIKEVEVDIGIQATIFKKDNIKFFIHHCGDETILRQKTLLFTSMNRLKRKINQYTFDFSEDLTVLI